MVICKKSYAILFFILLLALTMNVNAAVKTFTNGGGTEVWTDANNWNTGTVPTTGDYAVVGSTASADSNDLDELVIDANVTAIGLVQLLIGHNKTGDWVAHMTGGTVTATSVNPFYMSNAATAPPMTTEFNMSGGTLGMTGNYSRIANNGDATFNISGGEATFFHLYVGINGDGVINQTGGTVNTTGLGVIGNTQSATYSISAGAWNAMPTNGSWNPIKLGAQKATCSGTLNISGTADVNLVSAAAAALIGGVGDGTINMTGGSFRMSNGTVRIGIPGSGSGQVNLDGGILTAEYDTDPLTIEENGNVDLESSGLLKLKNPADGDWISRLEGYVGDNRLTTYDQTNRAEVIIEVQDDYTVAYAGPVDFNLAWGSGPAIGSDTVPAGTVDLDWTAGDNTASTNGNIIFIGTDENAVTNAAGGDTGDATYLATTTDSEYLSYSVPNYGEEFFWRVDQVDATDSSLVYKGKVWNFSTTSFMMVDEFDSYADDMALLDVWSETPAFSIFLNTDADYIVDGNSLKIAFNNAGGATTTTSITFSSAMDLPSVGLAALNLNFKGEDDNPAEPFSVALKDSTGTSYAVAYESPIDMSRGIWTNPVLWSVDLQEYADNGVDLTDVYELIIRIGDGVSTGSGSLYIDEIAFVASRPDDEQLEVVQITAVEPNSAGLRAYYTFDETSGSTAGDSAGDFDGTVTNGVWDIDNAWNTDGVHNGCMAFDGDIFVECPNSLINDITTGEITISLWAKGDTSLPYNFSALVCGGRTGTRPIVMAAAPYGDVFGGIDYKNCYWNAGNLTEYPYQDQVYVDFVDSADFEGSWKHYAFVKNVNTGLQQTYIDGILRGENTNAPIPFAGGVERFAIGSLFNSVLTTFPYTGKIDDVRIYDEALSQAEIVSLAGLASVDQELLSPADNQP